MQIPDAKVREIIKALDHPAHVELRSYLESRLKESIIPRKKQLGVYTPDKSALHY